MNGANLIATERQRQIACEGYTSRNDDTYVRGELLRAATSYLDAAYGQVAAHRKPPKQPPSGWPWDAHHWKPDSEIKNLVKAAALIAAEIDRLRRIEESESFTIDPERYM